MRTREIVNLLAQKLDCSEETTAALLAQVAGTLRHELSEHDSFRLPNLGTFGTNERPAHRWYDPRSHRLRWLPAHFAVFFHASGQLKRLLRRKD